MDETVLGLEGLLNVGRTLGPPGIGAWVFLWLLRRGDRRDAQAAAVQRENIDELRRQRDYYRMRAEAAEQELARQSDTSELPVMGRDEGPS